MAYIVFYINDLNSMMRETSVTVFILLFMYPSYDPFGRGSIRRIFRSLPSLVTNPLARR